MPSTAATPRQRAILALLLLLGAALRLYNLGHRSLSTDEANVFWMARGTASEIVLHNAAGNSAPPLYALALNPLAEMHASEAVLRSLSCAAGVAALAALYVLARDYSGPVGALFAVFVAAIAPAQVFYAQFLREYSLAFLCAALLLLAFTRFQRSAGWRTCMRAGRRGRARPLRAVRPGTAGPGAQPGVRRRAAARRPAGAARRAVGAGAGRVARRRLGRLRPDTPPPAPSRRLRRVLSRTGILGRVAAVAGAAGGRPTASSSSASPIRRCRSCKLLVGLGIVRFWRTPDGRRAILLLITPVLVTLGAACLRLYPYLGGRQSMMLTVMLYVCAASGFVLLRSLDWKWVGTTIVVAWLAAEGVYGAYRTLISTEPQHMRPVVAQLAERVEPGDRIYVYHFAVDAVSLLLPGGAQRVDRRRRQPGRSAAHERQTRRRPCPTGPRVAAVLAVRGGECDVSAAPPPRVRPLTGRRRHRHRALPGGGGQRRFRDPSAAARVPDPRAAPHGCGRGAPWRARVASQSSVPNSHR